MCNRLHNMMIIVSVIKRKRWRNMSTIREVAKAAHVSVATVSRVMNETG